ncbi:LytR/AlgR family response regulator transcription factor [Tahibacter amnicola]|uniref:LytTR family DNA-binding domain-containing protein n=1 Tax=Tahibacter amnicola TaxID=2976241 RepID=A0ABY6B9L3_9GAMM|nr:LytTR family DNA-binding domain-containing protein [Tahibacter amnicola]UXI66247.1 LytTR family DNA-binding domain-containing protein [Tahibacter amnicola]
MMQVAVVDDEPLARRAVIARLAEHGDVTLAGEYADGYSAYEAFLASPPDVAFIDVQMPRMNGLTLLARLPPARRPLAILLTAFDSFGVRAFELNAVDYLLKPIDDRRFNEALDRVRRWRGHPALAPVGTPAVSAGSVRFEIRVGRRVTFVDAADVEWIESDGDYVRLHVGDRAHLLREPLHRLAERLDPARFVRVHRSIIVRVDCVCELQPLVNRDAMLRLRDGTPVRASRTYIDALMDSLRQSGTITG